ncbi:MAG: hypothetical protein KatS3mg112_1840 [Thermogutta sp.]|nr:MAG: hypothetical protein KatS3mg112_1840 [Thermogutta sp.]
MAAVASLRNWRPFDPLPEQQVLSEVVEPAVQCAALFPL